MGPPLLSPAVRPWAGALLACSVFVVGVLGVLFAHQAHADPLDHAIDTPVIAWFAEHPGLASRLASPGSLIPAAALTVAIAMACVVAGRLNGAVLVLVAVPASVGLDELLLKPLFGRTYLGHLAYPSGHTTAAVAYAATVSVLLLVPPHPGRTRALRIAVSTGMWLLACVVAAAVIGLQWHYFTDTVAGAAVGLGTVCGVALLLDRPIVRAAIARVSPLPVTAEVS